MLDGLLPDQICLGIGEKDIFEEALKDPNVCARLYSLGHLYFLSVQVIIVIVVCGQFITSLPRTWELQTKRRMMRDLLKIRDPDKRMARLMDMCMEEAIQDHKGPGRHQELRRNQELREHYFKRMTEQGKKPNLDIFLDEEGEIWFCLGCFKHHALLEEQYALVEGQDEEHSRTVDMHITQSLWSVCWCCGRTLFSPWSRWY